MDAVILDVGGVLLLPHPEPVSDVLERPIEAPQAERAHYFGVHALDAADDEPAGRQAYLEAYVAALELPAEQRPEAVSRLAALWGGPNLELWRLPVSGSVEGLKQLAETPCKLAIVSNADGSIEQQLRTRQICQVGEGLGVPVLAIIDSGVVGVQKPAADIFHHALEPLAVEPANALYVGDTVRYDVTGARAAGLVPVHFDPFDLCPQRHDHDHVHRLAEVVRLTQP